MSASEIWRPQIGNYRLLDVRHSTLVKIADEPDWSKKTYNNVISVLDRAFKFGFHDHPERHDPSSGLMSVRIRKRDRFTIHEAEKLNAAIHGTAESRFAAACARVVPRHQGERQSRTAVVICHWICHSASAATSQMLEKTGNNWRRERDPYRFLCG